MTGNEDILVGMPTAGRMDAGLEALIGLFTSTLVIRGDLAGDPTFLELVARTRKSMLEAYENQDLPFEKLVEMVNPKRSLVHSPLFQVMFILQNTPKRVLSLPGLTLEELELLRLGPMSIKRRVRTLGGDLTLDSKPGQGAGLKIRLAT
jgi:non-ribosomal peptide synthetase component F